MTSPAKRSKQDHVYRLQYRQIWAVLASIAMGFVISWWQQDAGFLVAKGMAAGSVLAYIAQYAFTHLAYRTTGSRHARQIMLNTYLAMATKWLIVIAGFVLIFTKLAPINAFATLFGYIIMQVVQFWSLSLLK